MFTKRLSLAIAGLVVSTTMADVIVTMNGEKIAGTVKRYEHGKNSLVTSRFVIEVDGEEQDVPVFKVESVTFGTDTPAPRQAERDDSPRGSTSVKPRAKPKDSTSDGYWLSSSGKRHNSSCRYYNSGKGRSCGSSDGVACKICGG